jgi:hypothetical protein
MAAIMPDNRAFRLLDLPVELRLMVYEHLPGRHYSFLFEVKTDFKAVTTHHITVQGSLYHNHMPMVRMEHPTNTITLVTKTFETSFWRHAARSTSKLPASLALVSKSCAQSQPASSST